jgi:hypothetical protein
MGHKPKLTSLTLQLTPDNEAAIREHWSYLLALVIHDACRGKGHATRIIEEIQKSLIEATNHYLKITQHVARGIEFTLLKHEISKVVTKNEKGSLALDEKSVKVSEYQWLKRFIKPRRTLDSLTRAVYLQRLHDSGKSIDERSLGRDLQAFRRWTKEFGLVYLGNKTFAGPRFGDDPDRVYRIEVVPPTTKLASTRHPRRKKP